MTAQHGIALPATGATSGAGATAGSAARAMVRLRPVPTSAPAAERWPGVRVHRLVPVDQPQLPWLTDDDRLSDQLTGRLSRTGAVRIVRFGDSWAGPLADDLPDPGPWSANLAVGLAEALRGARPVAQLNRWLSPFAISQLTVQRAGPGAVRRRCCSRCTCSAPVRTLWRSWRSSASPAPACRRWHSGWSRWPIAGCAPLWRPGRRSADRERNDHPLSMIQVCPGASVMFSPADVFSVIGPEVDFRCQLPVILRPWE